MKRNRRRVRAAPCSPGWPWPARWLAAIAGLAAAVVGVVWAVGRIESHPYFAVREIDVEAHGALDAETLLAWAGIAPGASVWSVHELEAERRAARRTRAFARRTSNARCRGRSESEWRNADPWRVLLADRPLPRGAGRSDVPRYGRRSARRSPVRHGLFRERADARPRSRGASVTPLGWSSSGATVGRGRLRRFAPTATSSSCSSWVRRWRCASPRKPTPTTSRGLVGGSRAMARPRGAARVHRPLAAGRRRSSSCDAPARAAPVGRLSNHGETIPPHRRPRHRHHQDRRAGRGDR